MKDEKICPCLDRKCIKDKCAWWSGLTKTCVTFLIGISVYAQNQGWRLDPSRSDKEEDTDDEG
jgi:hypothetical protein